VSKKCVSVTTTTPPILTTTAAPQTTTKVTTATTITITTTTALVTPTQGQSEKAYDAIISSPEHTFFANSLKTYLGLGI
jgi:hypothetical protein